MPKTLDVLPQIARDNLQGEDPRIQFLAAILFETIRTSTSDDYSKIRAALDKGIDSILTHENTLRGC